MKRIRQSGKWWTRVGLALSAVLLSTTAWAQVRNGSIEGTIKDNTAGALPGVTITLTSPALQVPEMLTTSGGDGTYKFVDLPIGLYRLAYQLQGFAPFVREEIRITVGFAARVDVAMQLAGVAETILVRGQSPLVDVVNTSGGATITQELMSQVPTNLNLTALYMLSPGMMPAAGGLANQSLDNTVGTTSLGANITNLTYGQSVRTGNWIEGIKSIQAEIPDLLATEEVDIKTFGNTAETDLPGANLNIVYRSGGNDFHGRLNGEFHDPSFASNNLDDELRKQGISNRVGYLNRFGGDLGGRVVRNQLWFFGAYQRAQAEKNVPGFSKDAGPDGEYLTGDETPGTPIEKAWNYSYKLSYQSSLKHKFAFFGAYEPANSTDYLATRFIPHESSRYSRTDGRHHKIEWTAVFTSRLLVNVLVAESGYLIVYRPHVDEPFTPCRFFRDKGYATGNGCSASVSGAGGSVSAPWLDRSTRRKQVSGAVTYYGGEDFFLGSHDLKAGFIYLPGWLDQEVPAGIFNEYRLVYDRVPGGLYRPVEFWASDPPTVSTSRQILWGAYVMDTWRPTKRLTLNLGLRWDWTDAFVPPQIKEQGRFGFSGTFDRLDVGTWSGFAPRIGAAFDVFGDGRTVVKATFGVFNHAEFNNNPVPNTVAGPYNKNNPTTYTYRWRDQDGDNDYTPGEVNLDINGPDFLDIQGVSNNVVNPDLRWGSTREVTASLEHELLPNISVRGLWVYKQVVDELQSRRFVNILRPLSVWNQAFTRRDPGPDGALNTGDDGGTVVVYDYDLAYRGARFVENMIVNVPPGRTDWFHNLELTLTKRPGTGKWFATTSFLTTRNHRWLEATPESPNGEYFPVDQTWRWNYRLTGGYELPYGFTTSTNYQIIQGTPGQRTVIFRAADPDGGPRFPSSTAITLRMGEWGAERTPTRRVWNARLSKRLTRQLRVDLDAFNLLNTNVPFGANYLSGPTFGFVTQIADPRVLRIGGRFDF